MQIIFFFEIYKNIYKKIEWSFSYRSQTCIDTYIYLEKKESLTQILQSYSQKLFCVENNREWIWSLFNDLFSSLGLFTKRRFSIQERSSPWSSQWVPVPLETLHSPRTRFHCPWTNLAYKICTRCISVHPPSTKPPSSIRVSSTIANKRACTACSRR